MPPRSTLPPKGSAFPANDSATYRDLLMFEERLKTTAANLQRRKHRYQLFLTQLLVIIAFLTCEVLLPPHISLLAIPYKMLLQRILPEIYTPETQVTLHPAFALGLWFVCMTTLLLFFVSGMYSDKIAYANKYVPHANRALRSFNMFLNVRKPPLRSKLGFNPLQFFFPRPDPPAPTSTDSAPASPPQSPIPTRSISRSRSTPMPISPIPPSTNPRGELIFSSRVDQNFRESYEKYRATFERHKLEKDNLARMQRGWFGVSWLRLNHPRLTRLFFWRKVSEVVESGIPRSPEKLVGSSLLVRTPTGTSTRSSKGGGSRSGTPPSTPKHVSKQRDRSSSRTRTPGTRQSTPSRQSTPPVSPSPSRHGSTRGRRDLGGKDKDGGLSGEGTELNLRAFALEKSALHNIGE